MSRRLLLDGEDLRSLMLRVRDEMGPGARIVKAERVRTGGIAGFFARERYELTVEVPDPPRRLRLPSLPTAPPAGAAGPAGGPADGADHREPVGLDALLAAAEAAEGGDGAAGPAPRAFTPAGPPPRVGTGGDAASPVVSTATESFAEVLASVREMVGVPSDAEEPDGAGAAGSDAGSGADASPDAPQAGGDAREPRAAAVAAPAPHPVTDRPGGTAGALLELGIPVRLLAGVTDPAAPVVLSDLVRRFERAPGVRLSPGAVVVVVGANDLALRTAMQMAHRADLAGTDVVLAGEMGAVTGHGRRLQSTGAAQRFRSRVPDDVPTVVALGVGPSPEQAAAGAELLEALAPHEVWAAVDSRRRAVELRRWLRGVAARRPVDALAATAMFEAQAPGTVLNLGVPVGWVDGLPASPVVWAAVLSERLADDARWE